MTSGHQSGTENPRFFVPGIYRPCRMGSTAPDADYLAPLVSPAGTQVGHLGAEVTSCVDIVFEQRLEPVRYSACSSSTTTTTAVVVVHVRHVAGETSSSRLAHGDIFIT